MLTDAEFNDLTYRICSLPYAVLEKPEKVRQVLKAFFVSLVLHDFEHEEREALHELEVHGVSEVMRKLDTLLNLNRLSHAVKCEQKEITMKGVFTVTFTVEPGAPPPLSVTTPEDLGPVGGPLNETAVGIKGGTPPYTVALDPSSGPLPPGVSIDGSGNITGTPTEAGSFEVTLDVADSLDAPTAKGADGKAGIPGTPKATMSPSGALVHGQ